PPRPARGGAGWGAPPAEAPARADAAGPGPDAAAAPRGPDRVRDPDHRSVRLLDLQLPRREQEELVQELHGEDRDGRERLRADRPPVERCADDAGDQVR